MQYAIVRLGEVERIIDAEEDRSLRHHFDTLEDGLLPDDDKFELVYGAYLPQPSQNEEDALKYAEMARGFWLGSVDDKVCHAVGLEDVKFFEPVRLGLSIRIPFAGLICIREDALKLIRNDGVRALTCFLRYREMSPATNVLNRNGVFAIKAHDKRVKGPLTKEAWQASIDQERALAVASRVR